MSLFKGQTGIRGLFSRIGAFFRAGVQLVATFGQKFALFKPGLINSSWPEKFRLFRLIFVLLIDIKLRLIGRTQNYVHVHWTWANQLSTYRICIMLFSPTVHKVINYWNLHRSGDVLTFEMWPSLQLSAFSFEVLQVEGSGIFKIICLLWWLITRLPTETFRGCDINVFECDSNTFICWTLGYH